MKVYKTCFICRPHKIKRKSGDLALVCGLAIVL